MALEVFDRGAFAGVRWWSYYDPRWGSVGLWEVRGPSVLDVEPLAMHHPVVVESADVLNRIIET